MNCYTYIFVVYELLKQEVVCVHLNHIAKLMTTL